ncbi:nucleotidyltransferase family protein [Qipengyuania sp.]|uniref:nucleotidyltransferase family protein n=1 Tax=Qipengyuania sp. TaxID=2004515 RepID=UPI0035C80B13
MSDCARPLDPSIGFALLAAGRGRRFGDGKLAADLGGMPLWRWAARCAERAGFTTRYLIVAGEGALPRTEDAVGWQQAVNPRADEGISTSIQLACRLAADCDRLVLGLADMPFVEASHLRQIALEDGVVFTRYPSGRNGVPAGFPNSEFATLAGVRGDRGAASLDWTMPVESCSAPPDSLMDVDRQADLHLARARLERESN